MLEQEQFQVPLQALTRYAKRIQRNYNSHTATELTYYDDLRSFLEEIFPNSKGYLVQSGYSIKGSLNKPDLTVLYNGIVLFHIEAKTPDTNIEKIIEYDEKHRLNDQIKRYQEEGAQLLITNFIDFILMDSPDIESDKSQNQVKSKCNVLYRVKEKFKPSDDAIPRLNRLLVQTCEEHIKTISNIQKLVHPLSDIAKGIKKKAFYLLDKNKNEKNLSRTEKIAASYLETIRDDFKKSIFKEEIEDDNRLFSDLFAQTIIYGAFSAWITFNQDLTQDKKFSIDIIEDYLPYGSFIRDLFLTLKSKIPIEFKEILDELQVRLDKTEYTGRVNTESVITTFYSDFLKLYDPDTAKNRGVVYTPHEIVDFIIDGIDFLLKHWLDKPEGLISEDKVIEAVKKRTPELKQINLIKNLEKIHKKPIDRLRILDPAAGTMAFACGLLHFARKAYFRKYPAHPSLALSAFEKWVKKTFFSNVYAFEILMAPYVLGHMRTFMTLKNLGLSLDSQDYRLNSFLMNTLMTPPKDKKIEEWIFKNFDIGREIKEALKIREHKDIFVIMGNPPYNLSSQNNCEWINEKIVDYKKGLKERNLKILSDDYVKFIRFGQWKIQQVGTGILAFITNSRYLEGQVFSVMRKSLRKTFDYIYIVNLHGDMRKKETGNPFDIRVGVSIAFMVRKDNSPNKKASVFYMDVPHPKREEKFAILSKGFQLDNFRLLEETYKDFFVEIDTTYLERFHRFIPIDKIFKSRPTSGIMAGRDRLVYDVDKENLRYKLKLFFNEEFDKLEELKIKVNDTKSWKKSKVYKNTSLENVLSNFRTINYRGWDLRTIAYDRILLEGHRMGYIDQIEKNNPAITVTKSSRKKQFETSFIVENLLEKCFMAVTDTSYAFPLYLNDEININKQDLPFKTSYKEIFYYIYAVLFSPTYRERYDEYLKKNFPRIPFTTEKTLFYQMAELGETLANIHLLKHNISFKFELSETESENWLIKDYFYDNKKQILFFDKTSDRTNIPYITGITPEIWSFSIGGIKQIKQYLDSRQYSKSRKYNTLQRGLNHDELVYLLKFITAIDKTIEILPEIDRIYKKIDLIN